MADRSTKALLLAIALGIWAGVASDWIDASDETARADARRLAAYIREEIQTLGRPKVAAPRRPIEDYTDAELEEIVRRGAPERDQLDDLLDQYDPEVKAKSQRQPRIFREQDFLSEGSAKPPFDPSKPYEVVPD